MATIILLVRFVEMLLCLAEASGLYKLFGPEIYFKPFEVANDMSDR
jgi:hypothetical protein